MMASRFVMPRVRQHNGFGCHQTVRWVSLACCPGDTVIKITSPRQMATFLCNSIWTLGSALVRNSLTHIYTFSLSTIWAEKLTHFMTVRVWFMLLRLFSFAHRTPWLHRQKLQHPHPCPRCLNMPARDGPPQRTTTRFSRWEIASLASLWTTLLHVEPPEARRSYFAM